MTPPPDEKPKQFLGLWVKKKFQKLLKPLYLSTPKILVFFFKIKLFSEFDFDLLFLRYGIYIFT